MVNPPKPGDPSYDQHKAEEEGIIASLRRRAQMITDGFNACEGITCNYTEGAMYSFPKLQLPPKVPTCISDTADTLSASTCMPHRALFSQSEDASLRLDVGTV